MSFGVVAAVGGTILGGVLGAKGAKDAANIQANSADYAAQLQYQQQQQARQDYAPYRQGGYKALDRMGYLLGLDADGFRQQAPVRPTRTEGMSDKEWNQKLDQWQQERQQYTTQRERLEQNPNFGRLTRGFTAGDLNRDPVYQSGLEFGLDQGTDAINSRAAQGGLYNSGSTLKALTKYANDYGSTKANESFNRWNAQNDSLYNRLAGISGTGQAATNQVTASGSNAAANMGNAAMQAGNANAAGVVGGYKAWGNAAENFFNNPQTANWWKGLNGGSQMNDFTEYGGGYSDYTGDY